MKFSLLEVRFRSLGTCGCLSTNGRELRVKQEGIHLPGAAAIGESQHEAPEDGVGRNWLLISSATARDNYNAMH
jgi:hypothetical protein